MTYPKQLDTIEAEHSTFVPIECEPRGVPVLNPPKISDAAVLQLVSEINSRGFGVIQNYLAQDALQSAQAFVETSVAAAGDEYVAFTKKEAVSGTVFAALSDHKEFEDLLHRVYQVGVGERAPRQSLYQVLRCLKGQSGLRHALFFHYDTYVVTALLPVSIPTTGRMGHLVMLPNWRRKRSNYVMNVIDKIILDNRLTQKLLHAAHKRGWKKLTTVTLVPGNLYFFWGYRTVHGNEACDPDQLRATALYHFGDPHLDSKIRKLTGKAEGRAVATA